MLKYVFYIALIKSYLPLGQPRLIIRDDRKEMREYVEAHPENVIIDIVEYDFKNKVKKFYTVKEFLKG